MFSITKLERFVRAVAAVAAISYLAVNGEETRSDELPVVIDEYFVRRVEPCPVAGFRVLGGDWQLRDGVVSVGPGRGPKLVLEDTNISTGKVGAEVFFADKRSGNIGLLVKVSDADVGADKWNGYEVSLYADKQVLHLARHRQNYEPICHVPCEVPVGQWISLVVEMNETTLKISVNDKLIHRYEDEEHPLATGQIALRPWQREARYRDLWLEKDGKKQEVALVRPEGRTTLLDGWTSGMTGTAKAEFALNEATGSDGLSSQQIGFAAGRGAVRLMKGEGVSVKEGGVYRGYVWAKSDQVPTGLSVGLDNPQLSSIAEANLPIQSGRMVQVPFSLFASRSCEDARFTLKMKLPGSVNIYRAYLECSDWAWPDELRRESLPPIAFITRYPLGRPNAVALDLWMSRPRAPGCSIRVVDPVEPGHPAETIFEDPDGCIYDMNVSDDARTLFFSYRRHDERHWHLWRINTDGSGLKQLTAGPYYDVSPCPMPNGDVVFVSTRRFGHTVCQPGPASNLYCMSADGENVRCVSMNTLSDFSPQMLPDGRVLFTRWEYIDRDLTFRQSLWTQYPDGTVYQLYFGNTIRDVATFWQARPLPGCNDRVVATFAPHHGYPHGAIGLINRDAGPEGPRGEGFRYITPGFGTIGDHQQEWAYRDPFPLSERSFLSSSGDAELQRYRLYLLDAEGRKRLLYEDPVQSCYFPIPLQPKETPVRIPDRVEAVPRVPETTEGNPTGIVMLADVYEGLEPTIARGRVKSIRVMEQVRKTEDLVSRAFDQSPLMSYGTYYAKRDWGTVAVEEDGSAHFRVPALREIYFQVLDAEGRELQRMTSGLQLMPGERVSCIGCHEGRQSTPRSLSGLPLAAHMPPRDLKPPEWGTDGILDYPSLVQPVLDRHCVECHSGPTPDGGYDLTGDKTRYFSMSYDICWGGVAPIDSMTWRRARCLPTRPPRGSHWFTSSGCCVRRRLSISR